MGLMVHVGIHPMFVGNVRGVVNFFVNVHKSLVIRLDHMGAFLVMMKFRRRKYD